MAALKPEPCPLCGGVAVVVKPDYRRWNITCGKSAVSGCGLVLLGDYGVSRAKIVDRWNSRASERNSDGVKIG